MHRRILENESIFGQNLIAETSTILHIRDAKNQIWLN